MSGHDMWVWERDEDRVGNPIGSVRDIYSTGQVTPKDDDSQDWSLESHSTAQLEDGTEYDVFISRRAVDTSDRRDETFLFVSSFAFTLPRTGSRVCSTPLGGRTSRSTLPMPSSTSTWTRSLWTLVLEALSSPTRLSTLTTESSYTSAGAPSSSFKSPPPGT